MTYPRLPQNWHDAVSIFFEHEGEIRRPTASSRSKFGAAIPSDVSIQNPPLEFTDIEGNTFTRFPISFRPVNTTRGEVELPRATIPRSTADALAKANLKEVRASDILAVYERVDTDPVLYDILNVIVRQELDLTSFRLERTIEKFEA